MNKLGQDIVKLGKKKKGHTLEALLAKAKQEGDDRKANKQYNAEKGMQKLRTLKAEIAALPNRGPDDDAGQQAGDSSKKPSESAAASKAAT